jgi:hypothetical protein
MRTFTLYAAAALSLAAALSSPAAACPPAQGQIMYAPGRAPSCGTCDQGGSDVVPFEAPRTYAPQPQQTIIERAPAPVYVERAPTIIRERTPVYVERQRTIIRRELAPVYVQRATACVEQAPVFIPRQKAAFAGGASYAPVGGSAVVATVRRGGLFPSIGRGLFGVRETTVIQGGAAFTVRGRTNVRVR